jgi:hypothetical protein
MLIVLVMAILFSSFASVSFNEARLVGRYVDSLKAFWLAEAGVSKAIEILPASAGTQSLGDYSYTANTSFRVSINNRNYYDIASVGLVGSISRAINVIVRTGSVDPTKFQYGVAVANDLCWGGGCKKPPEDYLNPTVCNGHPCWKEFDTTINFRDLFGYDQSEVQQMATHYTENNFPGNISGITWVDVTPGSQLNLSGSQSGSGILIIAGDARFQGTYDFRGIIYVLGSFDARGTFDSYGSIVVASTVGVDSVNGTPTFHYDQTEITGALNLLVFQDKEVVSWGESSYTP